MLVDGVCWVTENHLVFKYISFLPHPEVLLFRTCIISLGCVTLLEMQNLLEYFWLSLCVCCYYDSQFLYFKMYQ